MEVDNTADKPVNKQEIRLVDINITNENTALNVMVNFLTLAHKRGVFSIDESAKIYECIKMFQKPQQSQQPI
jgi:glutathione synthase/RimK-type ligase-like ATP-grasp enzyme